MKKLVLYALALLVSLSAKADVNAYLTTALPEGSDFTFTVPAGTYTVYWGDDTKAAATVTSTGAPLTGKLNGNRVKISASAIEALTCVGQQLTRIVLPTGLKSLDCSNNQLKELSLQGQTQLLFLNCSDNELTSLDYLSSSPQLEELVASNNSFAYLTLPSNSQLVTLWVDGNKLASLSLANAPKLQSLVCNDNVLPRIGMPSAGLPELIDFWAPENKMKSLTLTNNTSLQLLNVENNGMTSLAMAVPAEPALATFVAGNSLTFLNLPLVGTYTQKLYTGDMAEIALERTAYAVGENITLPVMSKSELNGASLGTDYDWFDEDGNALENGSRDSDKDYYYPSGVRQKHIVAFLKAQPKKVYGEVTSRYFPGVKLRTPLIKVLASLDGVDAAQAAGKLTLRREGSYLFVSASQPTEVVVTDAGGALRWQGTVCGEQRIQMGRGIFVVNGHKFAF